MGTKQFGTGEGGISINMLSISQWVTCLAYGNIFCQLSWLYVLALEDRRPRRAVPFFVIVLNTLVNALSAIAHHSATADMATDTPLRFAEILLNAWLVSDFVASLEGLPFRQMNRNYRVLCEACNAFFDLLGCFLGAISTIVLLRRDIPWKEFPVAVDSYGALFPLVALAFARCLFRGMLKARDPAIAKISPYWKAAAAFAVMAMIGCFVYGCAPDTAPQHKEFLLIAVSAYLGHIISLARDNYERNPWY